MACETLWDLVTAHLHQLLPALPHSLLCFKHQARLIPASGHLHTPLFCLEYSPAALNVCLTDSHHSKLGSNTTYPPTNHESISSPCLIFL